MKIDVSKRYKVVSNDGQEDEVSLGDILAISQRTLLYFYPKDSTPGCTTEGKDFTCFKDAFLSNGIQIVGVSQDSIESHKNFISSEKLGINLLSDATGVLHKEFGVIGEKNMYGRISIGVIRSTFLLDKAGNVLEEWRNVKATGHVEKILKELTNKND